MNGQTVNTGLQVVLAAAALALFAPMTIGVPLEGPDRITVSDMSDAATQLGGKAHPGDVSFQRGIEADGSRWADGYLWSAGSTTSHGYLWSDDFRWSDASMWSGGFLWSETRSSGFFWSDALFGSNATVRSDRRQPQTATP